MLVIRDIDEQQASRLESRLLSELDRHSLLDEEILPLPGAAAAIGLVWRASSACSLLDTFMLADRRMYEHKRQSKQAVPSHNTPLGCPVA